MATNDQQPPNKRTVGFDCEFVKPPPSEYIQSRCPVCLYIIREPYQVECCGKNFCKACIIQIKDDKKACPSCDEKEFSGYPDKGVKRSLYDLKIRCSHQQEGCEWTEKLGELDDHLNTDPQLEKQLEGCQYVKIACINNCGDQIHRKDIKEHQNDHCPNRLFSCEHCRVYKATYNDVVQTHWPVCGSFPLSCPNKCSSIIQRQNIDTHVANECPLTITNCDFHHVGCTVKLPRQDMAEHIKTSFLTHISLLATLVGKLETENNQLKSELKQLATLVGKLDSDNRQLKAELKQLAKTAPPVVNSRLLAPPILTMTNYEQHKQDDDKWFSPPLYTHPQGYKICFKVYANGWSSANGTHVSVYVLFMKGEFDDSLNWPFRGIISFQLLDQATNEDHKVETVTYDDTVGDNISGRVTEGKRSKHGWGARKFIAHSELVPKYLQNNTLLFQVYEVEINCTGTDV